MTNSTSSLKSKCCKAALLFEMLILMTLAVACDFHPACKDPVLARCELYAKTVAELDGCSLPDVDAEEEEDWTKYPKVKQSDLLKEDLYSRDWRDLPDLKPAVIAQIACNRKYKESLERCLWVSVINK